MNVGFDYWNVISHHQQVRDLLQSLHHDEYGHYEVHVISAIGKTRIGTIAKDVHESLGWKFPVENIHEVVWENSKQSPELKLKKCQELGIEMFFDDRQDVVDLLNANGILAFLVPRKGVEKSDTEADRK